MPRFTKTVRDATGTEVTLERVTDAPAEIATLRVSGWDEEKATSETAPAAKADVDKTPAPKPATKPAPKPAAEA
ncbi:hypothetical protein [Actinomyces howellii]|uniref:Uncharacterized protein n=1 Tax=Actinomyces howellii TaxID=52771 RepID=A0A448HGQ6_9ACTO|nr:hypothetical protein [Actinomyces howellii]VEG28047.1 Uncharacterised protein [Actinomyces howellii]